MPEGAARTIQEDSKTKTHPLINCQFSTQSMMTDREEHPPMHTGTVTRVAADHQTWSIIFMGNVSRAMYPSTLMQSVIGAQYGVLNNNYWLVLNVLNVPNSTVAKRTMLKETSNK
jgi:hypothetical protein